MRERETETERDIEVDLCFYVFFCFKFSLMYTIFMCAVRKVHTTQCMYSRAP